MELGQAVCLLKKWDLNFISSGYKLFLLYQKTRHWSWPSIICSFLLAKECHGNAAENYHIFKEILSSLAFVFSSSRKYELFACNFGMQPKQNKALKENRVLFFKFPFQCRFVMRQKEYKEKQNKLCLTYCPHIGCMHKWAAQWNIQISDLTPGVGGKTMKLEHAWIFKDG